ncbi:hypothetical protein LZ32DRAFT_618411 [Colletotrichum eremochloae]|nr:hypothetical protein LZ32DRAFT_618411 [Colletotrichum eremochloae]
MAVYVTTFFNQESLTGGALRRAKTGLFLSSGVYQKANCLQGSLSYDQVQRCILVGTSSVDLGSIFQNGTHQRRAFVLYGEGNKGPSVFVHKIDVCAGFENESNHLLVIPGYCILQGFFGGRECQIWSVLCLFEHDFDSFHMIASYSPVEWRAKLVVLQRWQIDICAMLEKDSDCLRELDGDMQRGFCGLLRV